jgi:hypothetical protein
VADVTNGPGAGHEEDAAPAPHIASMPAPFGDPRRTSSARERRENEAA